MQPHFASRGCATALVLLVTCLVAIRVECAPQPTLSGTVLDQVGAVIIAQIDLYSGKHEWHTTTDQAGRFSFHALSPGMYDVEVTSRGFRKQIIQNIRIDSSEPAPMTITMLIASTGDSCVDSLLRYQYVDAIRGESGFRGVVLTGGVSVGSGATVSVLRSGSEGKPLTALTNDKGEFDFAGLEPGLYLLKASREGYADFAVSNVRVRPGKTLQVDFSMQPSGHITLC
jgi:Carboxypeptidase regulatory-like domain